ncbi:MAG: sugar phosphate isomerase/epimerase [Actinobacteria bacterium]|nr:sugar phosphate isomerase/epimerase [Actinomycetota bacterium]
MKLTFLTLPYLGVATLEDAIKRIASFGYDGVDLWAYSPHLHPDHYNKAERENIRKFVNSLNIEITGLSLPGPQTPHLNPSHPSEKVRKDAIKYFKDSVELAADVGAPFLPTVTGRLISGTSRKQARQWYKECIITMLETIGDRNIKLGIHPLPPAESEIICTIDDALELRDEIGSDKLKVIFECAGSNQLEPNFSDTLRKIGKHLGSVHASDNDGTGGVGAPQHNLPGTGTVDWARLFTVLREINYDGDIQVQIFPSFLYDVDGWAIKSLKFLSSFYDFKTKKYLI